MNLWVFHPFMYVNIYMNFPVLSYLQQLCCLSSFYWNRLGKFVWSSSSSWWWHSNYDCRLVCNTTTGYILTCLESYKHWWWCYCSNYIIFCCMHPECNKHYTVSSHARWTNHTKWRVLRQCIWIWTLEDMVTRSNHWVDTDGIWIYLHYIYTYWD